MAYAKGTDAAGGGSTVNQAWVNKVAEEKWAAEQEEKRRRERVEEQEAWNQSAREAAEAQAQAQKEAEMRARNEAAQKAAQEKARAEAYQRAQQEAAARAAQERQRQAEQEAEQQRRDEERARREEVQRQNQAAAEAQRQAYQNTLARAEEIRRQEEQQTAGNLVYPKTYAHGGNTAEELEAQWFAPKTETTATPAVTVSQPAEQSSEAVVNESWKEAPDSVAEVKVSQPRMRTATKRSEEPIVYTGESSTGAGNKTVRRMAANTKAALTEAESGMSPEQLAWLQSAEGQRALANQQAKQANDATLRGAALNSGITFSGQPITQDKRISGQPMSQEEAARLAALNQPASTSMRFVPRSNSEMLFPTDYGGTTIPAGGRPATPIAKMSAGNGTTQPAVSERTITFSGQPVPESSFLTGQDRIENEQLAYEQGMANYLRNNGAQADSNGSVPIAEWFRKGQAENGVYEQAYQDAYNQVIAAGGSYNQADTVAKNAGDMAVRNYRAQQPKTETPVSEGTSLYDEIMNVGTANRSGENRAEANAPTAPTGSAQTAAGTPTIRYNPRNNNNGQSGTQATNETPGNGSVKMTSNGGATGGRIGAANALDGTMSAEQSAAEVERNYRDGSQSGQRYVYRPAGSTGNGTNGGTTKGTSGSTTKAGTGEARAEKQAPKGSVTFTPSYKQGGNGVKLPYTKDGYTAADIEAVGNHARSDQKYYNGNKAYEGYYLAPNGKYYPIDQEKAAYYIANGNSYKGWEEPMREYYKTFGTYYGYRPDWKTAGGLNTWKQNTASTPRIPAGGSYSNNNSLSYAPSASGRSYGSSYGRGSTPNNGLYWNGNTSWSI